MCVCLVSFPVDIGGTVNMRTKLGMCQLSYTSYSVDSNCKMCCQNSRNICRHVFKWFLTTTKSEASYNWRELTHNNLFWKKKKPTPVPNGNKIHTTSPLCGGFNCCLCSPRKWGKWSIFDEHIFQMGWNHQLVLMEYMFINSFFKWPTESIFKLSKNTGQIIYPPGN